MNILTSEMNKLSPNLANKQKQEKKNLVKSDHSIT